jgi:DNA-binding PadR family transcriptional regulator
LQGDVDVGREDQHQEQRQPQTGWPTESGNEQPDRAEHLEESTQVERIAFFWHARHSQVYPELARLEGDGLVTHTVMAQRDRPDKKVYALTEQGRQTLLDWLLASTNPPQIRDEFLVKVTSFWLIEPDRAIGLLEEQARQHDERLAMLEGIERGMRADFESEIRDPAATPFATYLTLQRGLSYEREYAAWCRWAIAYIRQHQETSDEG